MSITIIVPVIDEAKNITPLIAGIRKALQWRNVRILFIDDSPNNDTVNAIEAADISFGCATLQMDYYHRQGDELWGGLSGAVIDGFRRAGSVAVVMDGDMQHSPSVIPALLNKIEREDAAIAMASRYCPGGSSAGLSGSFRQLVSIVSTWLAKLLFPKALKGVSDPMTGFFAVRLDAIDLDNLQPRGFKILLEILVRHPHLGVGEVPLWFGERANGESKGNLKQGLEYIRHLLKLRLGTRRRRPTYSTDEGECEHA